MGNKSKRISVIVAIAFSFLAYKFAKDIFKSGVRDGAITQAAVAKK